MFLLDRYRLILAIGIYIIKEGMAGLVEEEEPGDYQMQCFPLYSLILATGI